ncbi:type VII secretion target [Austwickia chelonae]|uniref:type VII secretion target n=1 Tax=Austwickia chelonae TaxID=100225 RepID=UPI000E24A4E0|nr:type VII secretion target [Austwickia chelonae]
MSGEFRVSPEAVRTLGSSFAQVSSKVSSAQSKPRSAAVPGQAWGVVGLFVESHYQRMNQGADKSLGQIADYATRLSESCRASAQSYEEQDRKVVVALRQIGKRL